MNKIKIILCCLLLLCVNMAIYADENEGIRIFGNYLLRLTDDAYWDDSFGNLSKITGRFYAALNCRDIEARLYLTKNMSMNQRYYNGQWWPEITTDLAVFEPKIRLYYENSNGGKGLVSLDKLGINDERHSWSFSEMFDFYSNTSFRKDFFDKDDPFIYGPMGLYGKVGLFDGAARVEFSEKNTGSYFGSRGILECIVRAEGGNEGLEIAVQAAFVTHTYRARSNDTYGFGAAYKTENLRFFTELQTLQNDRWPFEAKTVAGATICLGNGLSLTAEAENMLSYNTFFVECIQQKIFGASNMDLETRLIYMPHYAENLFYLLGIKGKINEFIRYSAKYLYGSLGNHTIGFDLIFEGYVLKD